MIPDLFSFSLEKDQMISVFRRRRRRRVLATSLAMGGLGLGIKEWDALGSEDRTELDA